MFKQVKIEYQAHIDLQEKFEVRTTHTRELPQFHIPYAFRILLHTIGRKCKGFVSKSFDLSVCIFSLALSIPIVDECIEQ